MSQMNDYDKWHQSVVPVTRNGQPLLTLAAVCMTADMVATGQQRYHVIPMWWEDLHKELRKRKRRCTNGH